MCSFCSKAHCRFGGISLHLIVEKEIVFSLFFLAPYLTKFFLPHPICCGISISGTLTKKMFSPFHLSSFSLVIEEFCPATFLCWFIYQQ